MSPGVISAGLRDAVRTVLGAALLATTDSMTEPADLIIRAAATASEVTLSVLTSPSGGGSVDRYDDGYRSLAWDDVRVLAAESQVKQDRQDRLLTMRFATAQPAPA